MKNPIPQPTTLRLPISATILSPKETMAEALVRAAYEDPDVRAFGANTPVEYQWSTVSSEWEETPYSTQLALRRRYRAVLTITVKDPEGQA